MHDMPDTDDADAAAERLWPEEYKHIIRRGLKNLFVAKTLAAESYKSIYQNSYTDQFSEYEAFIERLGEMVVIGAETGCDEMFDELYDTLEYQNRLPESREFACYFMPGLMTSDLKEKLHQKIVDEYEGLHAMEHLYEDYEGPLSFEAFIKKTADLVVKGSVSGADNALGKIYNAFLAKSKLPVFRRFSRRIQ